MSSHDQQKSSGFSRRSLILGATAVALTASALKIRAAQAGSPVIVTSWDFGPRANAVGWPILADGGLAIDAVEAAINHVELLPDEFWVGYGGVYNEVGEATLDAMMMWGPTHDVGAVGCLKRVKRAISVARKVMDKTQHTLIVGDDATRFAARMGFEETSLSTESSVKAWEEWAATGEPSDAWQGLAIVRSTLNKLESVGLQI